jgi:hypothetical protein
VRRAIRTLSASGAVESRQQSARVLGPRYLHARWPLSAEERSAEDADREKALAELRGVRRLARR